MSAPYIDPTAPDPMDGSFTAAWLTGQHFPAVEYVVPGIIPEGLTLLTAAPKIGKSWMVLGLGVAAATGALAFNRIQVPRRPVLYLALEDGPRRLQSRLRTIGVTTGPKDLTFMTSTPAGAATTIEAFLERNSDRKPLVVLDTLGKIRGVYTGSDAYGKDYSQMSGLKDLVDNHPGSSLIVVHHTKKAETTDFLDSVSGTQGLAGAADSILVLRRSRHESSAVLNVTSRDAAEGEYSVTFDGDTGTWSLDGLTLAQAAQAVETRKATEGVGDDMADLVAKVSQYEEGTKAADLALLLGWDLQKTRTYLARACESGRIQKLHRGVYAPVTSVLSVAFDHPDLAEQHTDNTQHISTAASA